MKTCPLCKKTKRIFQICAEQHFSCVECIVKYDNKVAKEHRPCPICNKRFDRPLMAKKLGMDVEIREKSIKFLIKGKTVFNLKVERTKGTDVNKQEYEQCSQYIEDFVVRGILEVLYQFQTFDSLSINDLILNTGKMNKVIDDNLNVKGEWKLVHKNNSTVLSINIKNIKQKRIKNSIKSKSRSKSRK